MASDQPGKNDTSEYSASKAPETREHAEEAKTKVDHRLQPGGTLGTPEPTGMSALDRADVPSEALKPDELRIGEMRRGDEEP